MSANNPCRQCPNCGSPLETWFQGEMLQALKKNGFEQEKVVSPEIDETVAPAPVVHEPVAKETASVELPTVTSVAETRPMASTTHNRIHRPALRAYIKEWLLVMVLGYSALETESVLAMFLGKEGVYKLGDFPWLLQLTSLIAILGMLYFISKITFSWMANRLYLKENAVESSVGIIARNTSSVRYSHVRSVEIIQGVIDRILDTGRIELATAGSADTEIVFARVARPMVIQQEINERIRAAGTQGD